MLQLGTIVSCVRRLHLVQPRNDGIGASCKGVHLVCNNPAILVGIGWQQALAQTSHPGTLSRQGRNAIPIVTACVQYHVQCLTMKDDMASW